MTPANTTDLSTDIQAAVPSIPMESNTVSKSNANQSSYSLEDMISRYVVIETFKWKTSSPRLPMNLTVNDYAANATKYLRQYILPQALLEKSSLIRQKLNNFMLFKADMEIDLKVNANPFQQGALLVAYSPRALSTSRFRGTGTEFLSSVTSLPNRVLYLEQGNSLSFRVPYANVLDYINLTSPDDSFGLLNIYVLSTLKGVTNSEEVDVTVRLRFVNVDVSVPTDNSLLMSEKYNALEIARLAPPRKSNVIHGLVAQMAEGEKEGPVSRIAGAVSTIGSTLSSVPVIGNAAQLVGWAARQVQKVATVYGWSKPVDLTMPTAVVQRTAAYMGNTEGKDASLVLAQIADNAIDCSDMTPSSQDEMALSSIFARPNVVARVSVPKQAFTQGRLLFSWEVSPFNYFTQQRDSDGQDFCLGTFSFASLMYKLWRGSIEYSLSTVKTQYHAARIMAVYFPNRMRIDLPETYGELMTSNLNMIYDLSAKADAEFSLTEPIVVAYSSEEPWKRTLFKNADGFYDSSTLNTCVGSIAVYCINELVCPDTVSQEVTFLLSVKAGSDYEVAIPQIQLQGGFATSSPPPFNPLLVSLINRAVGTIYSSPCAAQEKPSFVENAFSSGDQGVTKILQSSSTTTAEWLCLVGETMEIADGTYTATIDVQFSDPNFSYGDYAFTVIIADGKVSTATSDKITAITAQDGNTALTVLAAETSRFRAQMADDGTMPTPNDQLIMRNMPHIDLAKGTTGEYSKSLRPLMKRFIHTRNLASTSTANVTTGISLTPADFVNYDSSTVGALAIGTRAWSDGLNSGGLVPESWLSLVSYLYRFCAGSVRSKIFIPTGVRATTSLDITSDLYTEFGTPKSDPEFVISGHINNVVETTVPYYGQYRARTVSDQVRGTSAKQRIEFSRTGNDPRPYPYYEAAGDDFSFWFLVGPPVMRPADVLPTAIPTIAPPV